MAAAGQRPRLLGSRSLLESGAAQTATSSPRPKDRPPPQVRLKEKRRLFAWRLTALSRPFASSGNKPESGAQPAGQSPGSQTPPLISTYYFQMDPRCRPSDAATFRTNPENCFYWVVTTRRHTFQNTNVRIADSFLWKFQCPGFAAGGPKIRRKVGRAPNRMASRKRCGRST